LPTEHAEELGADFPGEPSRVETLLGEMAVTSAAGDGGRGLLRSDGHVVRVGDDQQDLVGRLPTWFGAAIC
jgi:hypothetical protein